MLGIRKPMPFQTNALSEPGGKIVTGMKLFKQYEIKVSLLHPKVGQLLLP